MSEPPTPQDGGEDTTPVILSGQKTPNTERGVTPESTGRPRSTASSDIVFEAKKKKKRGGTPSTISTDEGHEVTFTVTIAMAVPTVHDDHDSSTPVSHRQWSAGKKEHDDQPDLREMLKKRMIDAPRAQNYYHLEYYLLPEDDELMKTDVVTYGVACKIYMERHDARVVKTWQDGEVTWFSWAHSHTVTVTKEMLLKMFNHTMELRVWDTKDKCSTRARFDRPKAFRLPQPKPGERPEDIGGVKAMVTKQMKHFLNQQPKKGVPIRPLPSQISVPNLASRKQSMSVGESRSGRISPSAASKVLVAVPNKDSREGRTFSRLGQLAGAGPLEERSSPTEKKSAGAGGRGGGGGGGKKEGGPKSQPSSPSKSPSNSRAPTRSNAASLEPGEGENKAAVRKTSSTKEDRELKKQMAEQAKANAERIKKYGVCTIPLRLALLFGDRKIVTSRLDTPLAGIEDMFLGVSVNLPLLSPHQKEELNPMIIQVKSATSMPSSPLSFADLRLKCHPVYCKYKFFKEIDHETPSKEHDKDIYWEDTNVVLLGTLNRDELREYLNGPPMEIHIHDRDRKPEQVALKPMLFGDDLEDEKIANVGTVESRRTLHNPFQGRDKPWDPYGVAKIDLSELLLGHRYMELKVPIHNCPLPDLLGADQSTGRLMGVAGAVDGPVERPLSAGHYIQDTAMLKVRIELAHPLISPQQLAAKENILASKECPFSRIVFIFDYQNLAMLHNVQSLVMGFNAQALELDSMPQHVIDAALSTYKLSVVQQCSLDLDIVTGFHVMDGEKHIFVLEGLKEKSISHLWTALPQRENSDVKVLYNSDLSFSRRLYGPLDVDLCRVKLHEPLSVIVQQSLLYVRDMVVRPCFDALTKLDQLTKSDKMTEVVRNELFPRAEMVVSMSREFGVPFTQKDFEELQPATEVEVFDQRDSEPKPYQAEPSRDWTPIDNFNHEYMEQLKKGKKRHNYVESNIADVQTMSEISHAERQRTKKPHISVDVDVAHNYSTQALNSTELAREKLRQYLKEQDPNSKYAFNQEYMSAMFCPVNLDQEAKEMMEADHAMWRTSQGWIYPGMRSTKDSNVHPRKPDPARLDELKEEWIENILHANQFKSPLDRDRFPWPCRREDLELYAQPEPDFGNKEPLSIMLPGVKQQEEKTAVKVQQQKDWESRIVVDDVRQHFYRLLPETELRMKGFYSSNQLDRLRGLLKDPVTKKSLSGPEGGPDVNAIPPLAVVNDPRLDTLARSQGHPLYPAIPEAYSRFCGFKPGEFSHPWAVDDNHIHCYNYEHQKFRALKGHDFNVYHKPQSKLSHRPIHRLRPEERENHLFRIPVFSANPYRQPLPDVGCLRAHSAHPDINQSGHDVAAIDPECHTMTGSVETSGETKVTSSNSGDTSAPGVSGVECGPQAVQVAA